MVGIASQLSHAKLEETGEATSRSGRLPSKENSTNTWRNNREFMNGARTPSLRPPSAADRFEAQLFTSEILARIYRSGGGKKERETEKNQDPPGVRSWLAHCRCRVDRKISRKFGAHHGNQSITTSSSKVDFSRESNFTPPPCRASNSCRTFNVIPSWGCIRRGMGKEKKLYYRFNEVWPNSFIGEKLRVLLEATRCCIAETRFPAR